MILFLLYNDVQFFAKISPHTYIHEFNEYYYSIRWNSLLESIRSEIFCAKSFEGRDGGEKKREREERSRLTRWPRARGLSVQVAPRGVGGRVPDGENGRYELDRSQIRAGNPERQGGLAYPPGNGSGEGGRWKKGGHCARLCARLRTNAGRKHPPARILGIGNPVAIKGRE